MAHFYSECKGKAKTKGSRLGHRSTGVNALVASWAGSCRIDLQWDPDQECDILTVTLDRWHDAGVNKPVTLYKGRIDQYMPTFDCQKDIAFRNLAIQHKNAVRAHREPKDPRDQLVDFDQVRW